MTGEEVQALTMLQHNQEVLFEEREFTDCIEVQVGVGLRNWKIGWMLAHHRLTIRGS